jgi:hypothetical protein
MRLMSWNDSVLLSQNPLEHRFKEIAISPAGNQREWLWSASKRFAQFEGRIHAYIKHIDCGIKYSRNTITRKDFVPISTLLYKRSAL